MKDLMRFYNGKKVLITGHTGFKGTWMTAALLMAGADVTGYALKPEDDPNMHTLLGFDKGAASGRGTLTNVYSDIRDLSGLKEAFDAAKPEIVIHMAAQPIVRKSYEDPVCTYEVNVMGTVNVLECCRHTGSVKSVINVTTDKVYRNMERSKGYREDEELCGFDPYSNSKSCSELVTDCYRNSFLKDGDIAVTTMRAGNVIGGGDFAKDRIIPDCVRAAAANEDIIVRNPASTRPYQHVLEPVMCYLFAAKRQYEDASLAGCYNVGPDDTDAVTTAQIATMFCDMWNRAGDGPDIRWINRSDGGPHEANFLRLDITKIKKVLSWHPRWNIERAMEELVRWYRGYTEGRDVLKITEDQIRKYTEGF
ncbi:MAG: CDP-glucose 4,6-dehydratase [Lachnospiraceae bacterium]|nr:CDP-glucose 4,6-dehydratase [Lachnospiraceae bacterium]